jgi:hypothetical protein
MRVHYVGEAGHPAGSTELIAKIRVARSEFVSEFDPGHMLLSYDPGEGFEVTMPGRISRFFEVAIAVAGSTGE